MAFRTLIVGVLFTAAALLLVSERLDVRISLRSNDATADVTTEPLWVEGPATPFQRNAPSFADLAERLSPAVVNIRTERTRESGSSMGPEELFEEFFGRRGPRRERRPREATGSGFIISQDGYIVTNNHVVAEADKILIALNDGREFEAETVGLDPKTDLALLKVTGDAEVPVAPLGNSDQVRVGDWVMAIGNPFGLEHTVTVGILSAKGRNINAGPYDDFLQTDASINPGNSGGPLIDMEGRVIGINTAINAAGQGIGFAIPINMVKELLPQLREHGSVTRGWLGVQIQRVDPSLADAFGLDTAEGALISQVFEGSPAERAGLQRRDVIVKFDGADIRNYDDLPRRVASVRPGSEVEIVVIRDGKRKKLKAVVDEMEQETVPTALRTSPGSAWGFEVTDLTSERAEELGVGPDTQGVLVESVEEDAAARRAGLRRGDIIVEANRREVKSVGDLEKALEKEDERAVLLVQRGESTIYLAFEREETQ